VTRGVAFLVPLLFAGLAGAQTPRIRIDDAGRGIGPQILARAIAGAHTVISPATTRYVLPRDSTVHSTLIVLGRDAAIEGRVDGDVLVVGGDLYMHPGGSIRGRAIAYGGGVYESMLAHIGAGYTAFRDFTYDIQPIDGGYALRYRVVSSVVTQRSVLPAWLGFDIPTYDRTNGLSLGAGPSIMPAGTPFSIASRITYRSQLGRLDPWALVSANLDRTTTLSLSVGRATQSNDRWIRSDLVNSATFFANGDDTRDFYRETGGTLRLDRSWETVSGSVAPYIGARYERASSVGPGSGAVGGPWTLLARKDSEHDDRSRPNPAVDDGRVTSGIAGVAWLWSADAMTASATVDGELGRLSDCQACNAFTPSPRQPGPFAQMTFNGRIEFPTFGTQRLRVDGHLVTSSGETPRQRFAYIGGAGTLPTMELLSEGGDQLAFLEGRYLIPLDRVQLPMLGAPTLAVRELLGGARGGSFPTLHQATGVRVSVSALFAEYLVDPVAHRGVAAIGLSSGR
jgi:hypothetical protein